MAGLDDEGGENLGGSVTEVLRKPDLEWRLDERLAGREAFDPAAEVECDGPRLDGRQDEARVLVPTAGGVSGKVDLLHVYVGRALGRKVNPESFDLGRFGERAFGEYGGFEGTR